MITAPAFATSTTVTLTAIRRLVQGRLHDDVLLAALESTFDAEPARAMLRHRMPEHRWRDGQLDGHEFHRELTAAVHRGTPPSRAPSHLRAALRLLENYHFKPIPRFPASEITYVDEKLGVRGIPDLVGYANGRRAIIEIKTVHTIPHDYAYLEHALQTSLLFQLVWGHRPHSQNNFLRVLYVESSAPHRAYLLPVQMPNRFCDVATALAHHLRG